MRQLLIELGVLVIDLQEHLELLVQHLLQGLILLDVAVEYHPEHLPLGQVPQIQVALHLRVVEQTGVFLEGP